jgi:hypothetical protein
MLTNVLARRAEKDPEVSGRLWRDCRFYFLHHHHVAAVAQETLPRD